MPLYQFRCNACGHTEELFRRFTEKAYSFCIECVSGVMVKEVTPPHLHGSPNMPNG